MTSTILPTDPPDGLTWASLYSNLRAQFGRAIADINALQTGMSGALPLAGGTMSGAIISSAGSAAFPAYAVSPGGKGFYDFGSNVIGWSINSTAAGTLTASGYTVATAASSAAYNLNAATVIVTSATAGVAPEFSLQRARGTIASPLAVAQNDWIAPFYARAHDGTTYRTMGLQLWTVIAATPGAADMPGRLATWSCASGSGGITELHRMEWPTGLSYGGANPYLDPNRCFQNRTATLGTLHIASAAGKQEFATDLGGGANLLVNDGTNTKRLGDGGYATVATDAAFTLTVLTSAVNQRHTGTLTADRAVTLSTTGAYAGAQFLITRTGAGAFNLNIGTGPLKTLATNTWCRVVYDGSAWYLAAYGAL